MFDFCQFIGHFSVFLRFSGCSWKVQFNEIFIQISSIKKKSQTTVFLLNINKVQDEWPQRLDIFEKKNGRLKGFYIRKAMAKNNVEVKTAMAAPDSISSIRGRKSSRSISEGL